MFSRKEGKAIDQLSDESKTSDSDVVSVDNFFFSKNFSLSQRKSREANCGPGAIAAMVSGPSGRYWEPSELPSNK